MYKIRWTIQAFTDLKNIADHISADNIQAAKQMITHIRSVVRKLADYPQIGRMGRIDDTREFAVPQSPYIIAYRIKGNTIEILAIMHDVMR